MTGLGRSCSPVQSYSIPISPRRTDEVSEQRRPEINQNIDGYTLLSLRHTTWETSPRTPDHVFTPMDSFGFVALGAAITELEGETSNTAGTGGPVSKIPRQVLEVALNHELSPGDKSTSETPSNDARSTLRACLTPESPLCCSNSKSRRNNRYLTPGLMRKFNVLPLPVDKSTDQCLLVPLGKFSDDTPLALQSTVIHGEAPINQDLVQAQDLQPADSYNRVRMFEEHLAAGNVPKFVIDRAETPRVRAMQVARLDIFCKTA
eukprot:gene25988-32502_t